MKRTYFFVVFFLLISALIFYFVNRRIKISHTQIGSIQMLEERKDPLYVFAVGDTGSGNADQMAVAQAMETRCKELKRFDGLFLLGDIFYMEGVHDVEDEQWATKVVNPYSTPCLSKANIYPIFGNHDYVGNKEALIEYSRENKRWKMPNRFYSLKFGNLVNFVAIDSNFLDLCLSPESCVGDFLRDQLGKRDTRWRIVLSHHPLASASKKGYLHSGETTFAKIARRLACGKAQLWLSGHAHHMEHRKSPSCGTDLFVSGGGGGELEPIKEKDKDMKFGVSKFGFLQLEITQDAVYAIFFDKSAQKIYNTSITTK